MDRNAIDIDRFLAARKSMIIAPAGHGKTHTIADCLEHYEGEKKILVLTHTHAGIASIREKVAQRLISSKKYEITTICSFAMNLASSFVLEKHLPDDSDMNEKYNACQKYSIQILKALPVRAVMAACYDHVIVDEYQDCDKLQHELIEELGKVVKVHILGDPMQGIFGFNGSPVDLNGEEFKEYRENLQTLETPWRWINSGNGELGLEIIKIRSLLEKGESVRITDYPRIEYVQSQRDDLYWRQGKGNLEEPEIRKKLKRCLRDGTTNVLVIHPLAHDKSSRVKIIKSVFNLGMLESIDDKDYYEFANEFENNRYEQLAASIKIFLKETCIASNISEWIKDDGTLVKKKSEEDKEKSAALRRVIESLDGATGGKGILYAIQEIRSLLNIIKVVRGDVYHTMETVLADADNMRVTFTEALKLNRDKVRRVGRNIKGKYIGTTLLTKGLECDTVIVLDAHKFADARHLYVALSRCTRRLIVAAESPVLNAREKKVKKRSLNEEAVQLSLF